MKWYGQEICQAIENEVQKRLVDCAQDLVEVSNDRTPLDSGDLRGSIKEDTKELDKLIVKVGSNLPYAARQHEEMDYKHMNGGAKYLERPLDEKAQTYINYVSAGVSEVIR